MTGETNKANHLGAIVSVVEEGVAIASVLVPQYRVYLVLGAAIARQVPGLYEDVLRLLEKGEPTAEEKAELSRKLQLLGNPERI